MRKSSVTIVNRLGLHARAAAQLVRLAGSFKSSIQLHRADTAHSADAKSILNVLTLAASKGVVLEVEIEGVDEDAALDAIHEIFRSGFGEL